MRYNKIRHKFRHTWAGVLCGLTLLFAGGVQAAVVLDSADANGIGDRGGSPFLFSFSSPAPAFEFALLELLDYDALGIAFTDDTGFVVSPLVEFSPAESILGSFMGTTGNYTAIVIGVGNGAFGLEVQSVPVPAAVWLFGSALGLLGWLKRKTA